MHARVVLGVGKGVLFREVSSFQRLKCMQEWYLGWEKVPCLERGHTQKTHTQARNWIKELRRMLGDKVTLCIVGNKIDLEKQRTVIEKDALE